MALEIDLINIEIIDVSNAALKNTLKNINHFDCGDIVSSYFCNILDSLPNNTYDVIISNPPYIPINEVDSLDITVKEYDPYNALTDYSDGMQFYQRIHDISDNILNENGCIIMEFGSIKQMNKIINYFKSYQYTVHNDLNGYPRIIELTK